MRELHVHDVFVKESRVGNKRRHGVFRRIVDIDGVVRAGNRTFAEVDEVLAADCVAGEVAYARYSVNRLRREERERMRGLEGGGVVGEDLVAVSARILVHVEARAGGIKVESVEARVAEAADLEGVLVGLPAERRDAEGGVERAGRFSAAGDHKSELGGNRAALPAAGAGTCAEEVARERGSHRDAVRRARKRLEFRDRIHLDRKRGILRVRVDHQIRAVFAQVYVMRVRPRANVDACLDGRIVVPRCGGVHACGRCQHKTCRKHTDDKRRIIHEHGPYDISDMHRHSFGFKFTLIVYQRRLNIGIAYYAAKLASAAIRPPTMTS